MLTHPVSHYLVSFTADEVTAIWKEASSNPGVQISRLDAFLAHVWILIIRARELQNDQQPVYLDITLGARPRLSPPLPETFVGSPIMLAKVTTNGVQCIKRNSSIHPLDYLKIQFIQHRCNVSRFSF